MATMREGEIKVRTGKSLKSLSDVANTIWALKQAEEAYRLAMVATQESLPDTLDFRRREFRKIREPEVVNLEMQTPISVTLLLASQSTGLVAFMFIAEVFYHYPRARKGIKVMRSDLRQIFEKIRKSLTTMNHFQSRDPELALEALERLERNLDTLQGPEVQRFIRECSNAGRTLTGGSPENFVLDVIDEDDHQ